MKWRLSHQLSTREDFFKNSHSVGEVSTAAGPDAVAATAAFQRDIIVALAY